MQIFPLYKQTMQIFPLYKQTMPASHLLLSSSLFFFFFICAETTETACPSPRFPPRIVPSKDDAQLKVLVPNITSESLRQLVNCADPSNVRGFCIDVFEAALSILPGKLSSATISYTCFNFSLKNPGVSNDTLSYNDMINAVVNGSYDVVVGDVTISAQRAYNVAFTQQYMESGVVIITKIANNDRTSDWLFFGLPFTWRMWSMVVGAFASTGFILWLLEHESNHELTEGSFTNRINNVFWFIMEALVLLRREPIKSTAGQLTMVAWVFVVLLLASSYTAGLSSFLTANNLSTTTIDILTVKGSNETIAYRKGSITEDFLTTRYHLQKTQLRPIRGSVDFINNITKGPSSGGVFAIIDELPYANIMLANLSCDYGISGPQLTREGFGFAFRHGLQQPWVKEVSIALLNLTESGCLQKMQDDQKLSVTNKCSSKGSESNQVSWRSISPLFIILLSIISFCVIISYIRKMKAQNSTTVVPIFVDSPSISTHREPLQTSTTTEVQMSTRF